MNQDGNKLMALGVLKAFNLSEAEIQRAEAAWGPLVVQAEQAAKAAAAAKAAEQQKAAESKAPAGK
jgi:hypothetical protein